MRGKAKKPEIASFSPGITPAYAGKSQFLYFAFCNRQDHPRLCGEKVVKVLANMLREGSPPPMRGKVVFSDAYDNLLKDHPRLCGEKNTCRLSA